MMTIVRYILKKMSFQSPRLKPELKQVASADGVGEIIGTASMYEAGDLELIMLPRAAPLAPGGGCRNCRL